MWLNLREPIFPVFSKVPFMIEVLTWFMLYVGSGQERLHFYLHKFITDVLYSKFLRVPSMIEVLT